MDTILVNTTLLNTDWLLYCAINCKKETKAIVKTNLKQLRIPYKLRIITFSVFRFETYSPCKKNNKVCT